MSKIGFIGAGNMAEALIKGLLSSGAFKKNDLAVSDIDRDRLKYIASCYGVETTEDNGKISHNCDIVIFAVKPSVLSAVLSGIKNKARSNKIYISIAAGVKTSLFQTVFRKNIKIVRVMPNSSCLAQAGASVLYFGELFSEEEKDLVLGIFSCVGTAYEVVEEQLLDGVTGLSGSGPAYVAIFIEALADAGVKVGLSRDLSNSLAMQTVFGTSKMLIDSKMHPAELKDMVASPKGTTINGIYALEKEGFRKAVMSAVAAATNRSIELSKEE